MITLFRHDHSKEADQIQSRLENMVAAHKVLGASEFDGPEEDLPVVADSGERYTGSDIEPFLQILENELRISRQISADACLSFR